MLTGLAHLAHDARSWPFEQARNLLAHVLRLRLEADAPARGGAPFRRRPSRGGCRLGFPFSPPRLSAWRQATDLPACRTSAPFRRSCAQTMVRTAFRALTDDRIRTELICFSDDMDGLRKAPPNVPRPGDAGGGHGQAAHRRARSLRRRTTASAPTTTLDLRALPGPVRVRLPLPVLHRGVPFGRVRRRVADLALERFDDIQTVMLPTLGPDRRATYSPFLPISPKTGRVLQVPTLERDVGRGTIVFEDEDGTRGRASGHGRPCETSVEARLGHALGRARDRLRDERQGPDRLGQGLQPHLQDPGTARRRRGFNYELFLDVEGAKISQVQGQRPQHGRLAALRRAREPGLLPVSVAQVGQAAAFRRDPQGGGRIHPEPGRLLAAGA